MLPKKALRCRAQGVSKATPEFDRSSIGKHKALGFKLQAMSHYFYLKLEVSAMFSRVQAFCLNYLTTLNVACMTIACPGKVQTMV